MSSWWKSLGQIVRQKDFFLRVTFPLKKLCHDTLKEQSDNLGNAYSENCILILVQNVKSYLLFVQHIVLFVVYATLNYY